ncbi:hypothetical protein [Rheinheimera oceanensis]|uniref:hypothetical protein n=1 Tax=Rheinheimera oceanensis TaxID=2817449 RepID=UPI001BFE6F2E|nr:hypothetical protein [Rheinheimera oceanensis]
MKYRIEDGKYTTLGPQELWAFYRGLSGLYRGAGSSGSPKLVRANGPRSKDVTIVYDAEHEIEMVLPDRTKGLSFASSVEKLAKTPIISGHVWLLPKGTMLPEGLIFNVKDKDHPLLNVSRKMSVSEFTEKLLVLSGKMVAANISVEKGTGKLVQNAALQDQKSKRY